MAVLLQPETTPEAGKVSLALDGDVALMTIDRQAKLNSFTLEMVREIERLSGEVGRDESIRALVVTGAGDRAFSAGGDLSSLLPATVNAGVDLVNPDPSRRFFSDVFKPVIAAVRGVCIGGGLELLLGTDIRIAGQDAKFGLGEVKWGLIPGAGTHVRLPRQIPWAISMELLLTGESIDAPRAHSVGLINRVVEPGRVLDTALDMAHMIARNGPVAVQTAKEIAVRALALTPGFELEHALNSRVLRSVDAQEGPAAFLQRRQPHFEGR